MAFRQVLRQRHALPVVAGALAASAVFYPQPAYADEAEAVKSNTHARKPIYDDPTDTQLRATPSDTTSRFDTSPSSPKTAATSPSPTDRLTVHVRRARLGLYEYSLVAEDTVNDVAARAFNLENNLTSTIQSLAPPRGSGEHVMPGVIYVLVSAMAGSILTRNRGIILRSLVPLGFGLTAGYYVIPITMSNVEKLVWSWEEQYPVIRDTHIDVQQRVTRFVETGKAHTQMTFDRAAESLADARKKMEDWVKQGK